MPPETIQGVERAGELLERLQELPWAIHGALLVGLLAGLMVWAFGRRVVKPTFALLGGVAGASLGFFLGPATTIHDVAGVPTPYIGLGLGGVLGLAAGIALFRFAMAASGGIVLAIVGVVSCVVYFDHFAPPQPVPEGEASGGQPEIEPEATPESAPEDPPETLEQPAEGESPDGAPDVAPAPEEAPTLAEAGEKMARDAAAKALAFSRALYDELSRRFDARPARARLIITAAAISGAALGVLAGLVFPRRSAGAITAMLGASAWVPCLFWQLQKLEAPGHAFLASLGPASWAGIWFGASLAGIAIQWTGMRARKKKESDEE